MAGLVDLGKRALKKAARLRELCQQFESTRGWAERDILASYIIIQVSNLWSAFSRSIYLVCILDSATTAKGVSITLPSARPASERDALLLAIDAVKTDVAATIRKSGRAVQPRDEPAWHEKGTLLRVFRVTGLSNEPSISSAINASSQTLQHMPTIRNFYAHRSAVTARKAFDVQLKYGFASSVHPTDFLAARPSGVPQNMIRLYVEEILVSVTIACS